MRQVWAVLVCLFLAGVCFAQVAAPPPPVSPKQLVFKIQLISTTAPEELLGSVGPSLAEVPTGHEPAPTPQGSRVGPSPWAKPGETIVCVNPTVDMEAVRRQLQANPATAKLIAEPTVSAPEGVAATTVVEDAEYGFGIMGHLEADGAVTVMAYANFIGAFGGESLFFPPQGAVQWRAKLGQVVAIAFVKPGVAPVFQPWYVWLVTVQEAKEGAAAEAK